MATRNDLCSNCRAIDFDELRQRKVLHRSRVANLSWITSASAVTCVLCNVFLRQLEQVGSANEGIALWKVRGRFSNGRVQDRGERDAYTVKLVYVAFESEHITGTLATSDMMLGKLC
jgi:hypothetical protein